MDTDPNKGASSRDDGLLNVSFDETGRPDVVPEPEIRPEKPKPKEPKILEMARGQNLKAILHYLKEPEIMKLFIKKHIHTLIWADEIRNDLMNILKKFAPDQKFNPDMEPSTLLKILQDTFENYERKLAVFDVTLGGTELLEGTALKFKIEESQKKIGELLESYQLRMNEAEDNAGHLMGIIQDNLQEIYHLERKVDQLYNALMMTQRGVFDETLPVQEEFFKELKEHLEQDQHLNSSLREELAQEKRSKHIFFKEICKLKEQRVWDEQEKMKEIAELARRYELDEGLRVAIVDKIETLTGNADEVEKAIEDWMRHISSSIADKEGEIQELKGKLKYWDDQVASMKYEIEEAYKQKHEFESMMIEMDRELDDKLKIFDSMQQKLEDLDQGIEELGSKIGSRSLSQTRYYDAELPPESIDYDARSPGPVEESMSEKPNLSLGSSHFSNGLHHSTPKSDVYSPDLNDKTSPGALHGSAKMSETDSFDISGSYSFSDEESPGKVRRGSPHRGETYFDNSNSTSIGSTPHSISLQNSITPPSRFRTPSPLMQNYGANGAMAGEDGTEAVPCTSRKLTPKRATVDPYTQNQVLNRFDVGRSFNMQTTCNTSTPYQQVARLETILPESGHSGRMIDQPLSIILSSQMTPTECQTPFISQSRFGYTDPTARVLNMPPDLESFKKVTPSQQQQSISPDVVTYGTPPAVTPTTTRRHGLFTPKGIFRKKHFNLRRLYDTDSFDSPELPWSPPADPSQVRTSPKSPDYLDKSIPWEEQYDDFHDDNILNKTFEETSVMDRAFDSTTPHATNKTFDASTPRGMNRTFDRPQGHAMNKTFDSSSPSDMNRTFDRPQGYAMDKTFDASSPYVLNRTFGRSPASSIDRTFDRSPGYPVDRTFDASSPYALNRTFDGSPIPAMDRTFEAMSPYAMDKTFDRSPVPAMNRTYDASPPYPIYRSFNKSLSSPLGRTFQQSPSYASSPYSMNKTFEQSPSVSSSPYSMSIAYDGSSPQAMKRTFDASPHHALNKTFNAPQSYTGDRKFIKSQSPQQGSVFHKRPSPNFNRTPPTNVTFGTNSTFNRSNSPVLDKTYDENRLSDGSYNAD